MLKKTAIFGLILAQQAFSASVNYDYSTMRLQGSGSAGASSSYYFDESAATYSSGYSDGCYGTYESGWSYAEGPTHVEVWPMSSFSNSAMVISSAGIDGYFTVDDGNSATTNGTVTLFVTASLEESSGSIIGNPQYFGSITVDDVDSINGVHMELTDDDTDAGVFQEGHTYHYHISLTAQTVAVEEILVAYNLYIDD